MDFCEVMTQDCPRDHEPLNTVGFNKPEIFNEDISITKRGLDGRKSMEIS